MLDLNTDGVISTINVEDKKLIIFYSKAYNGAWYYFKDDQEMGDYIESNPNLAHKFLMKGEKENTCYLNIASTQNFGYFKWRNSSECLTLLKYQLEIFNPIIDYFIIHAKKGDL